MTSFLPLSTASRPSGVQTLSAVQLSATVFFAFTSRSPLAIAVPTPARPTPPRIHPTVRVELDEDTLDDALPDVSTAPGCTSTCACSPIASDTDTDFGT